MSKGEPQGRWLDVDAAAAIMQDAWTEGLGEAVEVSIPEGVGEAVFEDGTTAPASMARLVPRAGGIWKTGFPILSPEP